MNTREVKYFAQSFTTSSDKLEIKYTSLLLLSLNSQVLLDPQLLFPRLPTFLEAWETATDVFTQNKSPVSMTFAGQVMEGKHLYYSFSD